MRFSLVVPAYNEERYLPRLLDSVDTARQAYRGGPAQVEVIIADNASTDATARIARERGCRMAAVEKWHYLTRMPRVGVGLLLGRDAGRAFADRYWYRPNR